MGKRIICTLVILGILGYGGAVNVFAEEWLGVFTTDTYPVDGCKIVKAGALIQNSHSFLAEQHRDEILENNEKNFIKRLSSSIINRSDELEKDAKVMGFNAIVGFKVIVSPMYKGFDTTRAFDPDGYGLAVVVGQGVPVRVQCDK